MSATVTDRPVSERALEVLRRSGNPFRNYFARNPDDEVCARYHVPELFAEERDLLLGVVDLYRYDPMTHSEIVPVLGNKGAGKTHLLHSIKHGSSGAWQLLVTPGVYQKDTEFLEYLLFQIIDTLLSGGRQRGIRPLEYVGEELVRRLLTKALGELTPAERLDYFANEGFAKWARRFGLGQSQASERLQWLVEALEGRGTLGRPSLTVKRAVSESGLTPERAYDIVTAYVQRSEAHNTAGLMRRSLYQGFARAVLLGDESDLASFVTFGFAELEFHVRPTRQDLVLALFKVLMEAFRSLKTPVVVAFDQLEDLLLARRSDDAHRVAEAFFAGIVQVMHQIDGLCFLIFAERGLWNRFVPSLDGYIQDRLNNPVHVPRYGTVQALRLEAPSMGMVRRVVEARMRPALEELPDYTDLSPIFPFSDEQVFRIAKTEPTLRDMLQQFRHLFDHVVYGNKAHPMTEAHTSPRLPLPEVTVKSVTVVQAPVSNPAATSSETEPLTIEPALPARMSSSTEPVTIDPVKPSTGAKTFCETPTMPEIRLDPPVASAPTPVPVQETPMIMDMAKPVAEAPPRFEMPESVPMPAPMARPKTQPATYGASGVSPVELWEQEQRAAKRKLEPEGALTGATRELQAGLGSLMQMAMEHGVKVGPWRLQHVVEEWTFGDHPTYGAITIAHWACKDGQPWKVGVGLFLGKGGGKPKDLEVKLASLEQEPAVIDYLILLRPEDDLSLTGKSKTLWAEAERRGRHARIEPVSTEGFALLYSFPRWLTTLTESLPEGQPLPNLADLIQQQAEKLLEQVCMPVDS